MGLSMSGGLGPIYLAKEIVFRIGFNQSDYIATTLNTHTYVGQKCN